MKNFKYSVALMVILTLAFIFIGCAKPPEAEKSAAAVAMNSALTAGADKYAAADLDAAKKILDTAESQMKEKMYKEAKLAYIDAKAAFEKAAAAAATGKQAVIAEANASAAAMEAAWLKLEETAKTLENKMMDKKEAWSADAAAFTTGLKAAKDAIPTDPIGAKAKIAELKAIADKWEASFTEIAATPAAPPAKAAKKK